ncbi:hypothetical protein [Nostoc sp.]|uniref:hypothetical protein n=1 Tax=Nostoc sp. TaxID=1180 RepID=UPI002FFA1F56
MAFQVRVTQTVKAEIDTAYSWLRERNPIYADKWFRELMDTIATLQEKPLRCVAPEMMYLLKKSVNLFRVSQEISTEFCLLFGKIQFLCFMSVIAPMLH